MEIIVTHEMSDFDALAACVAAQRLHPGATIVLGRLVGAPVRDFLALHKDRFPTIRYSALDAAAVTRMIVVDVRRRSRLGAFAAVLERVDRGEVDVHVWDHHGASPDDLRASVEVVEPVGSATTLLLEEIRRRELSVDAVEATLYAVAIHADTGSLVHARTTSRDARALAWLIDQGASQSMINRYLRVPFTVAQRGALAAVLDAIEVERIGGADVGLATVPIDRSTDGLADVVSEAIDLRGLHALFAVFPIVLPRGQAPRKQSRVQVIARARRPWIDVAAPLAELGGGGHAAAASAIVRDGDAEVIRAGLIGALRRVPPRPAFVRDVMSSPVHAVRHDAKLRELRESLRAWRHTGAPVLRDGVLAGIVSVRDLEKAEHDGALDLPVAGRMTHRVHTTTEDATVEDALATMVEHDVGRLPVLRDGRLAGIVTRSDVITTLYGSVE